ncbi:1-phosphofructokinase family hexose kinase [uncultured Enterococcus sp.]|uniref:1-phosphofructokinase family hexose kinase n=1 Tax=uncultured Enterococcus sp. TaxID=167972 RepID=UPI00262DFEF5|nr:1-phosphofructokinase family hexose kinase [uncultured Enterococcus sp.]
MIITITMNPSLDLNYITETFSSGKHNRVPAPVKSIGGKGINAGRTSSLLGSNVTLFGFLGGDWGNFVRKTLQSEELFNLEMIEVDEETRSAITIMHDNNTHTEIVEAGPHISDEKIEQLLEDLKIFCKQNNVTVISINGSVNNPNNTVYIQMIKYIRENISKTIPILLDISGDKLKTLLSQQEYLPDFIKPNIHEYAELINKSINSKNELLKNLDFEKFKGIKNILISCGGEGGIAKIDNTIYDITIPKIEIVSTTGSGDSSVGGFAYGLDRHLDTTDCLKYAMACGMSNAQFAGTGMIDTEKVEDFYKEIIIKKIN